MPNTCYECGKPATDKTFDGIPTCDGCSEDAQMKQALNEDRWNDGNPTYRDTRGMDHFYAGQEPPFEVNDEFARTGSIADY